MVGGPGMQVGRVSKLTSQGKGAQQVRVSTTQLHKLARDLPMAMASKEGEHTLAWWQQSPGSANMDTGAGAWRAMSIEAARVLPRARARAAQAGHRVAREWVLSPEKSKPGRLHRWANESKRKWHHEVNSLDTPALERAQPWKVLEEKAKPWRETWCPPGAEEKGGEADRAHQGRHCRLGRGR